MSDEIRPGSHWYIGYDPFELDPARDMMEARALAAEARVAMLEKALHDLLWLFSQDPSLGDHETPWGIVVEYAYEMTDWYPVPRRSWPVIRAAHTALGEPVPGEATDE